MTPVDTPAPAALGLRLAAGLFIVGPALIHIAVVPQHLATYVPYGIFLLAVGLAQLVLAAAVLLRPSPPLLIGGAAAMLAVVAVWIFSRTTGMPVGPSAWYREPIRLTDLLTSLMELVAVVLLLVADARLESRRPFRPLRTAPGLAVTLVASAGLTLAALAGVTAADH
jgi:hypothetical protein